MWWLSGPYGRFTTQSISFDAAGPTSESFTILTSQHVVQVDVYNGGTAASTVTLSCAGEPTVSMNFAAGQLATINTGCSGACSSVTVGSSNGSDTNFDNLVIQ